jgi:hypothetical protein
MAAKRLELLRELVRGAETIGLLVNPANPNSAAEAADAEAAARALGVKMHVEHASSERDIDAAFAGFVRARVNALFVAADPLFTARRDQMAALSARHAIPATYGPCPNVEAGGLMSYGAKYHGRLSPGRALYRPHPQGGEASRPAGRPRHQGRAGHQPANHPSVGSHRAALLSGRADEMLE